MRSKGRGGWAELNFPETANETKMTIVLSDFSVISQFNIYKAELSRSLGAQKCG